MPFDWKDYHTLADKLSRASDEASHRSSVSRAYYSAYSHARQKLCYPERYRMTQAELRQHGGMHKLIIDKLLDSTGDPNKVIAGNELTALRIDRMKADYQENATVDNVMAENSVLVADLIRTTLLP